MVGRSVPARLACLAWVSGAFLGLVVLVITVLRFWHPHFLPVTLALGGFLLACLGLVGGCGWRIARGPDRRRALGWLLVGLVPAGLFASQGLVGLQARFTRRIEQGPALKLLAGLGESLMDLEARFRYPERTVGDKVVMIAAPSPRARAQVRAMDAHIRALEQRLGRTMPGRVHWIRGPSLGMEEHALFSVCAGTPIDPSRPADSLDPVDRHEVAHCVIARFCNLASEPPSLLVEGWADACQGMEAVDLAGRAWRWRETERPFNLAELTRDPWASLHQLPAYVYGAPLVDHILRKYGPARFLSLYTTSRRGHFAEDCQRVLGVSLAQLDHDYWVEIERLVRAHGSPERRLLARFSLGPGVRPAGWMAFADAFLAARVRAQAEDGPLRIVESSRSIAARPGKPDSPLEYRAVYLRSGDRELYRSTGQDTDFLLLADPARSVSARRMPGQTQWELMDHGPEGSRDTFQWVRQAIRRNNRRCLEPHSWIDSALPTNRNDPENVVVTRLEITDRDGLSLVELTLEDRSREVYVPWRRMVLRFAPGLDMSLVAAEQWDNAGGPWSTEQAAFEWHAGRPVLRSTSSVRRSDGHTYTRTSAVLARSSGPIPEVAFDPARILGPDWRQYPVRKRYRPFEASLRGWPWTVVGLVASLVSGLVGACLLAGSRLGLTPPVGPI